MNKYIMEITLLIGLVIGVGFLGYQSFMGNGFEFIAERKADNSDDGLSPISILALASVTFMMLTMKARTRR